ncbi:MAG TPA: ribosomal protein S18-alanine N-acetyltransferase [Candidatus Atribacteria bacterium]|nr:ribosomal protein S18-alanine N-acetyltransferase [Candidatus Atribacteria bacterium]
MAQRSGDSETYLWEEGDFKISRMRPYHLPQIMAIERSSFPQPWSYSLFLSELSNRAATYFVAFFQSKIIGYLGLWTVWGEAHITTFAIHPAYRGEGFGKKLFGYALDYAKSQGCREVLLEVRSSNVKAQNLYRSFDFKRIGIRKHYYADGEDAWVMKKVF